MTAESKLDFDKYAFLKYTQNVGSAYRKQVFVMISECRLWVEAQEQSYESDNDLSIALASLAKALNSIVKTKGQTSSDDADKQLEFATKLFGEHERKYLFKEDPTEYNKRDKTFIKRMNEAKSKDSKLFSRIINKLFHSKTKDDEWKHKNKTTFTVKFFLRESLIRTATDTVVSQALCEGSDLEEILWNFSCIKDKDKDKDKDKMRITLNQNPHFYKELPTSLEAYGSRFQTDPIHDFHWQDVKEVYVLCNKPGHVYLETPKKKRAFGNTWVPAKAIIFKDVCGKLEGEDIVGECIESTADIWYCEKLSPLLSLYGISPTSVTDPHPIDTTPTTGTSFSGFWKELVRRKGDNHHLLIRTKPPESSNDWKLYSPTNTSPSSAGLTSPTQPSMTSSILPLSIGSPSSKPLAPKSTEPKAPESTKPPKARKSRPSKKCPNCWADKFFYSQCSDCKALSSQ